MRTASLARTEAGLSKAVMVTLKAALEERSQKPVLVSRLPEALLTKEASEHT